MLVTALSFYLSSWKKKKCSFSFYCTLLNILCVLSCPVEIVAPCPSSDFTCIDGSCIPLSKKCDSVPDCTSGEDERNCTSGYGTWQVLMSQMFYFLEFCFCCFVS